MDTAQILCKLKAVPSFLGVYPSDILPTSITRSAKLIEIQIHTPLVERTG